MPYRFLRQIGRFVNRTVKIAQQHQQLHSMREHLQSDEDI